MSVECETSLPIKSPSIYISKPYITVPFKREIPWIYISSYTQLISLSLYFSFTYIIYTYILNLNASCHIWPWIQYIYTSSPNTFETGIGNIYYIFSFLFIFSKDLKYNSSAILLLITFFFFFLFLLLYSHLNKRMRFIEVNGSFAFSLYINIIFNENK